MIVLILKAILRDNTIQLVIYILMFILGMGEGAAITRIIDEWEVNNDKDTVHKSTDGHIQG